MLDFTTLLITSTREFPTLKSEKGAPLTRRGLSLLGIIKGSAPAAPTPWLCAFFSVTSFNRLLFFYHVLAFSSPLLLQAMHSKWNEYGVLSQQPSGKCKRHFIFSSLSIKSLSGILVVLKDKTTQKEEIFRRLNICDCNCKFWSLWKDLPIKVSERVMGKETSVVIQFAVFCFKHNSLSLRSLDRLKIRLFGCSVHTETPYPH